MKTYAARDSGRYGWSTPIREIFLDMEKRSVFDCFKRLLFLFSEIEPAWLHHRRCPIVPIRLPNLVRFQAAGSTEDGF